MSAIVAVFALNRHEFSAGTIERMLTVLEHRGSDRVGTWSGCTQIQLGHRQRWTTEEALLESLPLESRNSGCVITCDARIDNRSELIRQLSLTDKPSSEISDSEIILAAYDAWGEDCLPRLIGDFVFAIWDPNSRKLFCGRDPLGVRHFYYYYEPGKMFALASEIKALFCIEGVTRRLNEKSVGDYLLFNFEDRESTFYSGIKRLPATHAMIVSENDLRIWEYWEPDFEKQIRLKDHREYGEAFREKFTEAVTSRLRTSYPVGSFLSGGLDSSAITCVASEQLAKQGKPRLKSFSVVWPTVSKENPRVDELSYMQSVIEKTRCEGHFVNCDDDNPWKDMDDVVSYVDHPVGFPNLYMHWGTFKAAKHEGVGVMLDGFDGDSTVSHGYEVFEHFSKQGRFLRMYKEARLLQANMPHKFHSTENLVFKKGIDLHVPAQLANVWYAVSRRKLKARNPNPTLTNGDRSWQIINGDFKETYRQQKNSASKYDLNRSRQPNNREGHWKSLVSGMYSKSLEVCEIASQLFSIDSRYPFFDRRLVEFCIALPPTERIYNGWTRAVFRNAMEGILPEDVRWRHTKANLGIGLKLNMLKYGSDDLNNVLFSNPSNIEGFVNIDELRNVYKRFRDNPLKTYDHDCMILVAVVHLGNWVTKNNLAK